METSTLLDSSPPQRVVFSVLLPLKRRISGKQNVEIGLTLDGFPVQPTRHFNVRDCLFREQWGFEQV